MDFFSSLSPWHTSCLRAPAELESKTSFVQLPWRGSDLVLTDTAKKLIAQSLSKSEKVIALHSRWLFCHNTTLGCLKERIKETLYHYLWSHRIFLSKPSSLGSYKSEIEKMKKVPQSESKCHPIARNFTFVKR